MWKAAFIFAAMLAAQWAQESRAAVFETPSPAAAGSHSATLTCPDKKFAVGIKGKSGSYVDSIGVLCDTVFVGPKPPPPATTKGFGQGGLPAGGKLRQGERQQQPSNPSPQEPPSGKK